MICITTVFNIVAPTTTQDTPSEELAKKHYPDVPVRGLQGNKGFWTVDKAKELMDWTHDEKE